MAAFENDKCTHHGEMRIFFDFRGFYYFKVFSLITFLILAYMELYGGVRVWKGKSAGLVQSATAKNKKAFEPQWSGVRFLAKKKN